jgi:hypothetical protein
MKDKALNVLWVDQLYLLHYCIYSNVVDIAKGSYLTKKEVLRADILNFFTNLPFV